MQYFVKSLLGLILSLVLLLFPILSFAQQNEATIEAKTTFELFWPLTAGRTADDPLYFLKTLKENLRGMLIFGLPQKAEYAVLLGTKRVLEADQLIKSGNKDVADKTLRKASEQFDIAEKNIDEAKSKKQSLSSSLVTIKPRIDNLIDFIPGLDSGLKEEVLLKIKAIRSKL